MDLDKCTSLRCQLIRPKTNPFKVGQHCGFGAVQLGHLCLLFGGYKTFEKPARFVFIYNTLKNSWQKVETSTHDLVHGRVAAAFLLDDNLLVYVRSRQTKRYNLVSINTVLLREWRNVYQLSQPHPGYGAAGCFVEERKEAVVLGGSNNPEFEVHIFSFAKSLWYCPHVRGEPPSARWEHAICSNGFRVFVFGGIQATQDPAELLDLHILTIRGVSFSWSSPCIAGYVPPNRSFTRATCGPNRVFVFGGYKELDKLDVYEIDKSVWREAGGKRKTNGIPYNTQWTSGTADHGAVQSMKELWIFGGVNLPPYSPLKITGF